MIKFTVNGIPAPQGSKRHVGGGRMIESSKKVAPWREAVRAEAQRALDHGATPASSGPVGLFVTFRLPRPQGHYGKRGLRPSAPTVPHTVPDLDKLLRSTLDGLVMGGVLGDDKQVWTISAVKVYADPEQNSPVGAVICLDDEWEADA